MIDSLSIFLTPHLFVSSFQIGPILRQYDFESSVGYWLGTATQSYQRALNAELEKYGITYRQSHVIGWLAKDKELCQTELAERMMIEPPTLVRILDRMEQAKLIQRTEAYGDRRKKIIRLLPAAEPIWEKIVDCVLDVRAMAVENFTAEEIQSLITGLRKLHDNVVAQTPEVVQPIS